MKDKIQNNKKFTAFVIIILVSSIVISLLAIAYVNPKKDDATEDTPTLSTEVIETESGGRKEASAETSDEEKADDGEKVEDDTKNAANEIEKETVPIQTDVTPTEHEESAVAYKDVDEYLYVTASVLNVRAGPGIDYEQIAGLTRNTRVHRIGVGDNGWSKIRHNNNEAYVKSSYLSYEKVVIETAVDEYLYVSASCLNVRGGAGTNYNKIGELDKNTKVHRIAVCDNGWSKIEYDSKQAYVYSKYLNCHKTMEDKYESIGRLTIASVNVDVPLYSINSTGLTAQDIVDRAESAVYLYRMDTYGYDIVADRVDQGFSAMKNVVADSTYATVELNGQTKTYICTKSFVGYNTGDDLTDIDGNSIRWKNDGGLCMYTNNYDGTIAITFWKQI